jgi:methylamine dehydrogenase light chain
VTKTPYGVADRWLETLARGLARRSSRRSFLSRLGGALAGAAAWPVLPVARAGAQPRAELPSDASIEGEAGDPAACEYWRYCGIDGFLCTCCGGSLTACPPGSEMARVTWIGTCRNPADGRDYIVSYNDCCGNALCGRCQCNRNEGDKPVYDAPRSNDINWCAGASAVTYHCTVALVLGAATEEAP